MEKEFWGNMDSVDNILSVSVADYVKKRTIVNMYNMDDNFKIIDTINVDGIYCIDLHIFYKDGILYNVISKHDGYMVCSKTLEYEVDGVSNFKFYGNNVFFLKDGELSVIDLVTNLSVECAAHDPIEHFSLKEQMLYYVANSKNNFTLHINDTIKNTTHNITHLPFTGTLHPDKGIVYLINSNKIIDGLINASINSIDIATGDITNLYTTSSLLNNDVLLTNSDKLFVSTLDNGDAFSGTVLCLKEWEFGWMKFKTLKSINGCLDFGRSMLIYKDKLIVSSLNPGLDECYSTIQIFSTNKLEHISTINII